MVEVGDHVLVERPHNYSYDNSPWWGDNVATKFTGRVYRIHDFRVVVKIDAEHLSSMRTSVHSPNWSCKPEWLTPTGGPW